MLSVMLQPSVHVHGLAKLTWRLSSTSVLLQLACLQEEVRIIICFVRLLCFCNEPLKMAVMY